MAARLPPPELPVARLWRLMFDVIVDQRVDDVRMWSYPYEFGFNVKQNTVQWRTPFVAGRKWEWHPMQEPKPKLA